MFASIAPLLLVFVVFYFLMIRPQQKRVKAQQMAEEEDTDPDVAGGRLRHVPPPAEHGLPAVPGPTGARSAPARPGLERARKARPAAFMDPARAGLITLGNLDDSLELLADWPHQNRAQPNLRRVYITVSGCLAGETPPKSWQEPGL